MLTFEDLSSGQSGMGEVGHQRGGCWKHKEEDLKHVREVTGRGSEECSQKDKHRVLKSQSNKERSTELAASVHKRCS